MVYSINPDPHREEFNEIIKEALFELNKEAKNPQSNLSKLTGNKLEPHITDVFNFVSKGTPFDSSFKWVGGQKFPDIVAYNYYGIEVKTTTQNHWKTTGNSVFESTRDQNVHRIFMMFAKLAEPIEFKCKPYEDCLSEIVVTHSPRYLVDMNLKAGETIFDKINLPYDKLREKDNPIIPIINYYKQKLQPGDALWWMDQEAKNPNNFVIKIWNNLTSEIKRNLSIKAMAFFPEIFGKSTTKFNGLSVWLVTREGVVCPNIRDLFTSGGQMDYIHQNKTYKSLPKIIYKLFTNINDVVKILNDTSCKELSGYWGYSTSEKTKILDWTKRASIFLRETNTLNYLDIEKMLNNLVVKS